MSPLRLSKKLLLWLSGILIALYIGLVGYFLNTIEIQYLLIYSGGEVKVAIPFGQKVCLAYLYNMRGDKQDIEALQNEVGATSILSSAPPSEREKMLKWFLSKGLNINSIGFDKSTALHRAVIFNAPEDVQLLLNNGASLSQKDTRLNMTPLEFAYLLQKKGAIKRDYSKVISLLEAQEKSQQSQNAK